MIDRSFLETLHTKRFSLVFRYEDQDGDEQITVGKGEAIFDPATNTISTYLDETSGRVLTLEAEDFDRIRPVPEGLEEILMGAEFFMEVYVENLPEGTDTGELRKLGFKLP
jgi:hypothetical protein